MRVLLLHPAYVMSEQARRRIRWLGVAIGCVVILCLMPIWLLVRVLDRDIRDHATQLETQRLLHPILQDLTEESETSRSLATHAPSLPAPKDLGGVIAGMQQLATLTGVNNARFVPAAETIRRQENQIRLDGRLDGSLDSFRRFFLRISEQEWLIRIDSIIISADSGSPTVTLSLWVRFR